MMEQAKMDMVNARRILVLGGARSGKSREAERLAAQPGIDVCYLATAEAGDAEMTERIRQHRNSRPAEWRTLEEPLDLAGCIAANAGPGRVLLVDCLTLWLCNILMAERNLEEEVARLAAAIRSAPGFLVLVSNETGLGIVPESALGRAFRDHQGRLNTRIGEACDAVVFMLAGHPLRLKPPSSASSVTLG